MGVFSVASATAKYLLLRDSAIALIPVLPSIPGKYFYWPFSVLCMIMLCPQGYTTTSSVVKKMLLGTSVFRPERNLGTSAILVASVGTSSFEPLSFYSSDCYIFT